jgi:hypothetical protein
VATHQDASLAAARRRATADLAAAGRWLGQPGCRLCRLWLGSGLRDAPATG